MALINYSESIIRGGRTFRADQFFWIKLPTVVERYVECPPEVVKHDHAVHEDASSNVEDFISQFEKYVKTGELRNG